jgi:hypothetical protein
MDAYALILLMTGLTLEAGLILRGKSRGLLSRFPLFYSYIAYAFSAAVVATLTLWLWPLSYPHVFWFNMLVMSLAEFAVLLELAEKVFHPYPVVRRMGRFIVAGICLSFFAFSIVPSILESRPSDVKFLELMKLFSLAKGVTIAALLGFARIHRVALGRPVAGILFGFAIYCSVSIANYAAAGEFGRSLYAEILWRLVPLSYALGLLIWTVTLWRCEVPVAPTRPDYEAPGGLSLPICEQLRRFNASLTRVLRRK